MNQLLNYNCKHNKFRVILFIAMLLINFLPGKLCAQDSLLVFRTTNRANLTWNVFRDAPYALYNHLTNESIEKLEKRQHEIEKLNSLADWQQKQHEIRSKLIEVMEPFPEKTPLNARVVRIIKKDFYKAEHIIFESQPGFAVTSTLFLPSSLKKGKKAPVVLYCCGHTPVGYRTEVYQHVILNLVKKGFIVFTFDPVGQGERLDYYNPETGKSSIGGGSVRQHSFPAAQAFIAGSSLARYMTWDGIRAIDYLCTRKEVDKERIGITGRSGGGTQSAYIAALDDRVYACAPECWVTNYKRLYESIGPQDGEQNLLFGIYQGIDQPDFLIARAPKPALLITTTNDFFSIQGARETQDEVSRIYKVYGKSDDFGRAEDFGKHESTKKNREALYVFFQKHLNNPGSNSDEVVEKLNEEEMRVTDSGLLGTSVGTETIFSLNCKEATKLYINLQESRKNPELHLSKAVKSAMEISGYHTPDKIGTPVLTGIVKGNGYTIEKYYVKGEGNYVIPFLRYSSEQKNGKALLYLHPDGKSAVATGNVGIEWFVKHGYQVIAPDLIGTGEMKDVDYKGDSFVGKESYNIWFAAVMSKRSIAGIRASDVNRLFAVMKNQFNIEDIYAVAKREMAPVLIHAAAFNPLITNIALIEPYVSYYSLVMNRNYSPDFVYNAVAGALQGYDLPDLIASLAPRKLLMTTITDGAGKTLNEKEQSEELSFVKSAYNNKNASDQFEIVSSTAECSLDSIFRKWQNFQ